jgi:hypothetical protein
MAKQMLNDGSVRLSEGLVLVLSCVVLCIGIERAHAATIDIILNPRPQYAENSCRSYALALAIAAVPKTPLPLANVGELRSAEQDLQSRLQATASKMTAEERLRNPKAIAYEAGSHQVWKRAVEEMSSKQLTVEVEYLQSPEAVLNRVAQLTGNGAAEKLGAVFSAAIVKIPVMTSVKRIARTNYKPSHIVTAYGVANMPGEKRALAVLNPAVKVAGKNRIACRLDDVRTDEVWSANVSLEPDFELTRFPDGFVVMWVRRRS